MPAKPTVSVVIPLYNKKNYILGAVESVRTQTFADLELIVVDDGSTDGGGDIPLGVGDDRLRLISQPNAGAAAARNTGIAAARGRWIAFLDADDTWQPERLERQLDLLKRHPDLTWAAGAFCWTNPDQTVRRLSTLPDEMWFETRNVVHDSLAILAHGRHIWTGTVIVRRTALLATGGFETSLRSGQDLLLWVRLAIDHPRLGYVRTALADYRANVPNSITLGQVVRGVTSVVELVRCLIRLGATVPPDRASLIARIIRDLALVQAKNHFVAGQFREARATLEAARPAGLTPEARTLLAATRLPSWPTGELCRFAINVRRAVSRRK